MYDIIKSGVDLINICPKTGVAPEGCIWWSTIDISYESYFLQLYTKGHMMVFIDYYKLDHKLDPYPSRQYVENKVDFTSLVNEAKSSNNLLPFL